MKIITIVLMSILSSTLSANTDLERFFNSEIAKDLCRRNNNSLFSTETNGEKIIYHFQDNLQATLVQVNLKTGGESVLKIEDKIRDIEIFEDQLYILTSERLFGLDLDTFSILYSLRTLPENMSYGKERVATGFHIGKNSIFIAHGEYGTAVINRTNFSDRNFINPELPHAQNGHRSKATDVVGNDENIFIAYDNITNTSKNRAFEGLVIWNKKKNELSKIIPLNQKMEAFYLPEMRINKNFILMQNLHLIFKYDLKKLAGSRTLRPSLRLWKIDNGKFTHRALRYKDYIGGCVQDNSSGKIRSVLIRK